MYRSVTNRIRTFLFFAIVVALVTVAVQPAPGGQIDLLSVDARVESDTFVSPLVGPSQRDTEEDTSNAPTETLTSDVFIPVSDYAVEAFVIAETFPDDDSLEVLGRAQVRLSHGLVNDLHQQFAANEVDYDIEFTVDGETPFMLSGFVDRDYLNSKVKTFATASVKSPDGRTEYGMIDLMTRSMKSDTFQLPTGEYVLSFHLDSRTDKAGGAESLDFALELAAVPEPSTGILLVLGLVTIFAGRRHSISAP